MIHRFTALTYLPMQLLAPVRGGPGLVPTKPDGADPRSRRRRMGRRRDRVRLSRLAGRPALPVRVRGGDDRARRRRRRVAAAGGARTRAPRAPLGRCSPWSGCWSSRWCPGALARARKERTDLKHERARTTVIGRLEATVGHLGGYKHIRECGEPVTTVRYVSILAYFMKLNDGKVGHRPKFELRQKLPDRDAGAAAQRLVGLPVAYGREHAAALRQSQRQLDLHGAPSQRRAGAQVIADRSADRVPRAR